MELYCGQDLPGTTLAVHFHENNCTQVCQPIRIKHSITNTNTVYIPKQEQLRSCLEVFSQYGRKLNVVIWEGKSSAFYSIALPSQAYRLIYDLQVILSDLKLTLLGTA